MGTYTPNYNLFKPEASVDANWGEAININWDTIDTQIYSLRDDIDNYLITTGSSFDTRLTSVEGGLASNTGLINVNIADIATNVADIATNLAGIATNADDITDNGVLISTNAANIVINDAAIATNASDISDHRNDFLEEHDATGTHTNVEASNLQVGDGINAYQFPNTDGNAPGQVLVTDGAGLLSWQTIAGATNTLQDVVDNGNVTTTWIGIGDGTMGPNAPIHINSTTQNQAAIFASEDDLTFIRISDDDTTAYAVVQDGYMSLGGNADLNAQNLNIDTSNGHVAIGTDTAIEMLTVNSLAQDNIARFTSSDDRGFIIIEDDDTICYIGAKDDYIFIGGTAGLGSPNVTIHQTTGAVRFNNAFTFPTADGGADQLLQTNGSGVLTWVDAGVAYTAGTGIDITTGTISTDDSAIDHDQLLNFVADEHIDWTSTTESIVTTGSAVFGSTSMTPTSALDLVNTVNSARQNIICYSDTTSKAPTIEFKKSHTDTIDTLVETIDEENLGEFVYKGVNSSSALALGAEIRVKQDGSAATFVPASMEFVTSSSTGTNDEHLFLDGPNARVGIGTNTPDTILDIVGTSRLKADLSTATAELVARNAADSAYAPLQLSGTQQLFDISGTEKARIDSDGFAVGKGAAAEALLDAVDSGSSASVMVQTFSTTDSHHSQILLRKSASSTIGTDSETADGEDISQIIFQGVNSSSAFARCATIKVEQSGSAGATHVPGSIRLYTNSSTGVNSQSTLYLTADGNVQMASGVRIGANSGDNQIDDSSNGSASTTLYIGNETIDTTVVSDARAKKDVTTTLYGLNEVLDMDVVDFNWVDDYSTDTARQTGMIAQAMERIIPTAVKCREDGYKMIDYKMLVPVLVKAIQELREEVKELKNASGK